MSLIAIHFLPDFLFVMYKKPLRPSIVKLFFMDKYNNKSMIEWIDC